METMCNGKGECLLQDDYYGYYKNPDMICNYNCVPINCKNYELCGKSFPEQYQKGEGTCLNCDIIFGKWIQSETCWAQSPVSGKGSRFYCKGIEEFN